MGLPGRRAQLVVLAIAMPASSVFGRGGLHAAGRANPRPARPTSAAESQFSAENGRALLDKYCITCHNERRRTAGLELDKTDIANIPAGAEIWEKVTKKLRLGAMPPPGMPRPERAASIAFASWLETTIDRA